MRHSRPLNRAGGTLGSYYDYEIEADLFCWVVFVCGLWL
jgi:hypothetical protein